MEDAFEILIYVVFIVISLIGGLYKNYAKKKEEQRKRQAPTVQYDESDEYNTVPGPLDEPQTAPKRNPFEEFIRQQLEMNEPEPRVVKEFEVEDSTDLVNKAKIEASKKEGNAVFQSTAQEIISDNMNDPDFSITDYFATEISPISNSIKDGEISDVDDLMSNFDLKKAVVYSEIVNRPKY